MARDASRVILLSGTPMPNSAAEIWAQLALVFPQGTLPGFEDFADRYAYRFVTYMAMEVYFASASSSKF